MECKRLKKDITLCIQKTQSVTDVKLHFHEFQLVWIILMLMEGNPSALRVKGRSWSSLTANDSNP
jgi:hypothetical protein